jgi:hypothetical protein
MLPITMDVTSTPTPDRYLMIGLSYTQTKIEVIPNDNKIQKYGFGLIPIINFLLGPLLDTPRHFSHSPLDKSTPISVHIPSSWYHIIFIKIRNTIHILHRLAIAIFISTLCIN